jgi:hypothetical protein
MEPPLSSPCFVFDAQLKINESHLRNPSSSASRVFTAAAGKEKRKEACGTASLQLKSVIFTSAQSQREAGDRVT